MASSEPEGQPRDVAVPRTPNGAILEVLRRIFAVSALVVGLAAILFVPEYLYVVEHVDWSAEYNKDSVDIPIAQYVASRLETTFQPCADSGWDEIDEQILEESSSATKPAGKLYPHNHPLVSRRDGIVLLQRGPERHYLRVRRLSTRSDLDHLSVPLLMRRPYLIYGVVCVLLALLVYALVRWRRRSTPVHYKPWVILISDVFGFLIAGGGSFFVAHAAVSSSIGDTIEATGFVVAFSLVLLLPSAYFASKRAAILPDRIRVLTLFGQRDFPFTRISNAAVTREAQAPILGILLIILGITNLVTAGIGIVMLVKKDLRITVTGDDGKKFKMWIRSADGIEDLQQSLLSNGVPGSYLGY